MYRKFRMGSQCIDHILDKNVRSKGYRSQMVFDFLKGFYLEFISKLKFSQ